MRFCRSHPERPAEPPRARCSECLATLRARRGHRGEMDAARLRAQRLREARRRSAGTCTQEEWRAQVERQRGRCCYCSDGRMPLGHEHLVPISRGGAGGASNTLAACRSCNTSRKAMDLWTQWVPKRPLRLPQLLRARQLAFAALYLAACAQAEPGHL